MLILVTQIFLIFFMCGMYEFFYSKIIPRTLAVFWLGILLLFMVCFSFFSFLFRVNVIHWDLPADNTFYVRVYKSKSKSIGTQMNTSFIFIYSI